MSADVVSSNLVARLRQEHERAFDWREYVAQAKLPKEDTLWSEAADEIERLSAALELEKRLAAERGALQDRLRAALRRAGVEAMGCSPAASTEFKTEALNSVIAICAAAEQGHDVRRAHETSGVMT